MGREILASTNEVARVRRERRPAILPECSTGIDRRPSDGEGHPRGSRCYPWLGSARGVADRPIHTCGFPPVCRRPCRIDRPEDGPWSPLIYRRRDSTVVHGDSRHTLRMLAERLMSSPTVRRCLCIRTASTRAPAVLAQPRSRVVCALGARFRAAIPLTGFPPLKQRPSPA